MILEAALPTSKGLNSLVEKAIAAQSEFLLVTLLSCAGLLTQPFVKNLEGNTL